MKLHTSLVLVLLSVCSPVLFAATQVLDLQCDYRLEPLGVEHKDPALAWRLATGRQGAAQTAYHIQAATSAEALAQHELWDSGWIESNHSVGIRYAGEPLTPTQRVYWRVRIKDEAGQISDWSQTSWFETGLWDEQNWGEAQWISCTREITPQYAPAEVMGPWVAPFEHLTVPKNEKSRYQLLISLPDTPVVYAGTWWAVGGKANSWCEVNGDGGRTIQRAGACKYSDFGFEFKPGENLIELVVDGANPSTPMTFGMHIVLADGTEQTISSSDQWTVRGGRDAAGGVRSVCKYGEAPLGQARIYNRAPLPAAWYKQDFTVDKPVADAQLYVCGLGYNEPFLNGVKTGDHVLDPGQTDYETFAHYQSFDVGDQLKPGANTLALLLGDGWYNQDRGFNSSGLLYGKPGLRALLRIRYKDGSETAVTSSDAWRWKPSEIQMSNVYLGDKVDFRKGHSEWKTSGMPAGWKPVKEVPPLSPRLVAQDFPPMREIRTIDPVKIWRIGEKAWGVDLGENVSGWIALDVSEAPGTVIRIRCSEMLESAFQLSRIPLC